MKRAPNRAATRQKGAKDHQHQPNQVDCQYKARRQNHTSVDLAMILPRRLELFTIALG